MLNRYELFVGLTYLRAQASNGFISFISLISMLGIAIGVAVLIVVLSVMNGFEVELRERILSLIAHATVEGFGRGIDDWPQARETALAHPHVIAAAPFVDEQGLLVDGPRQSGVIVRGIAPELERTVAHLDGHLLSGSLDALEPRAWRILLGRDLADALGAGPGDEVILVIAQGIVTPAGVVPRMRTFTVAGVFQAGMYEYDRNLAFVHMDDAARLFRRGTGVSGIRLRLDDMYLAPSVVREVARELGGGYYVNDWTRKHENFFRSIQLTKSILFVILLLVIGVAAFNIVSTLVMVVKEKAADIAILRTLGAAPRGIMQVFMVQGTVIGVAGTALGLAFGIGLAWNIEALVHGLERLLDTKFLAADVYFIDDLPARVQWPDVLRISLTALLLSLLSTLYPAWRAALTEPAEALRHE
ncbi:MAG TPA: lipoprotein-releasing ABC transporter permease subunit [Gammaproteobacteria bacterium]|nr:lipoprotein-releasing ABC transporter permease subunit [Gammaproteobacteria bacterium]